MDGAFRSIAPNPSSLWWEMNIPVAIALFLAISGGYFLLLDEDISRSRKFATHSRARSLRNSVHLHDHEKIRQLLAELGQGSDKEFELFRVSQFSKVFTGFVALFIGSIISGFSLLRGLVAGIICGIAIYFLLIKSLTSRVKKLRIQIESEFPAIVEMMTLSLSAGETPISAMSRISKRAQGPLANEFALVINAVTQGEPFQTALDSLGRRIQSPHIRRFVDALITAMLRGAPLIDVLQRHALSAREMQRNQIMNAAGKAELSMMIPVVFFILPISILFALWPSLANLNLFLA